MDSIKKTLGKNPLIKKIYFWNQNRKEFLYDKKFFLSNYFHSEGDTKEKNGYNILLIAHSLEKAMINKNPRRFGIEKVNNLIELIERYESNNFDTDDFAYIVGINILREYTEFYKKRGWQDTDEYIKVFNFLKTKEKIEKVNLATEYFRYSNEKKIDYFEFVKSRHSIREFQSKKLHEKDVEKAMEAVLFSPTACNRQMCKVYYVKDDQKAKKIIALAQGFGGFEKETINLFVVTFDVSANYFIGERNQGWLNTGLVSMNFVNALHSLGIGSCFCQFGNSSEDEETVKRIIGAKKSERVGVLIAAGYYPDNVAITKSPRKSLKDVYKVV
ncbi:nitroreductase family protein [Candidatus Saccharibacteria bacterium]|nr:nitroreductase family protein [Candidatus Saccharibacteria bacterium]